MKEFKIPVLIFHSVRKDAINDLFALDPKKFEDIIAFLKNNLEIVDFTNITEYILKKRKGGVIITFDDGYEDNYKVALPILKKYEAKAIFFISPKFIGKKNLWNTRADVILNHMNKKGVTAIIKDGHTIGSHGINHHKMIKLNDSEILSELKNSKIMIENKFKIKINSFAYPYGSYNEKVKKIAGRIYRYCFAADRGSANWDERDLNQIRREYVWPNKSLKEIENLIRNFGKYNNSPYKK